MLTIDLTRTSLPVLLAAMPEASRAAGKARKAFG
jgi:hypothetical protein